MVPQIAETLEDLVTGDFGHAELREVGTRILVDPRHSRDDDLLGHNGAPSNLIALKSMTCVCFLLVKAAALMYLPGEHQTDDLAEISVRSKKGLKLL
jgi:hypothetical protein